MGMITRKGFLSNKDLKKNKVLLDGGDFVYVREMTSSERDAFETSITKEVEKEDGSTVFVSTTDNFRSKIVVFSACDEKGDLIFRPEDVEVLGRQPGKVVDKISSASMELNRITSKDMDDLVKNSESGQVESSPSGSAKS